MPQDFSHQNLRGRSFRVKTLREQILSGADIKSADFTGTILRSANFSHANSGLQKRWAIFLVCISWLLSGVSGFIWSINGHLVSLIFDISGLENQIVGWTILILLIAYFFATIFQGIGTVGGAVAFAIAGAAVFAVAGSVAVVLVGVKVALEGGVGIGAGAGALALAFAVAGSVGGSVGNSVVFAIGGNLAIACVLHYSCSLCSSWKQSFTYSCSLCLCFGNQGIDLDLTFDKFSFGAVTLDGAGTLLSIYVGWRAIKGDEKYSLIRKIAIAFAVSGGTSFRNANLTDANFTAATLKNTDFTKANLTRTCFHKTKKLYLVRPGTTYLQKAQVVSVLVTGQGLDLNFDREDLRGVNFKDLNLVDATFIGADLSHANLQDADLTRAKLVQTQLDGTDFTGATLTGAFIEDWNITTDTKFDGVRCEYIYMRLPTLDNPDPHCKPDNRQEVFADGEFGDFIKPIFDTLDLYHSQGVDPRAIAISLKQLAENHPDAELEIVAMEKRGQDKFLLRAKTAATADKSELSAEYFSLYNQLKALAEQEVKALIAEKDGRIADLQNMVVTALQRPSFYSNVEQVGFMTNNPGGFSVGGSVDGDINNVQGENNQQRVSNKSSSFNLQGAQFAGGLVNADTVNAHQIGGNITNYSTEQKQNLAQAAAEIQQLLNQLSQTYPTATTSQKMSVVAKAVDEIESNPTLKARVIGALKAGGTEALKELIDNPLINILLASIEGWQEAE
jgi:uncharacterized protein YjbI with pentapeptide repeats